LPLNILLSVVVPLFSPKFGQHHNTFDLPLNIGVLKEFHFCNTRY